MAHSLWEVGFLKDDGIDHFMHKHCQMAKLKQFGNEFDALYSRESSPRIEGPQCHISSGTFLLGTLGKSEFYRALEAATRRQG